MSAHRHRGLSLVLATAILATLPWVAASQPQEGPATIATLAGRAELSRQQGPWVPAALRDQLSAGDAVRTIGGRLAVRTVSGQSLRLGAHTQIVLGTVATPGAPAPTLVRMDGGLMWVAVLPGSPEPAQIVVAAGRATITVRGGGTSIGTNPDGSVSVSVYYGAALASGDGWQRPLAQDQVLVVPPTGAPKETVSLKRDKHDAEWAKWNERQDSAGGYGARLEK
jgi:FecR protein